MNPYLLLGAGFSRNWGGLLASEAFEYLLGHAEVVNNDELRSILWATQPMGGFEAAMSNLQEEAKANASAADNLQRLETAVIAMFSDMNRGFDSLASWEFSQDIDNLVSKFLTQFAAIFTLNQDLLVERHYLDGSPELYRSDRWNGVGMPAISAGQKTASIIGRKWHILGEDSFKVEPRIQPYFKLHGSSNWVAPDGSATLVMGGNKLDLIGGSPILAWYRDEFEKRLCQGDARLMVIGYGFRDEHINEVIIRAIMESGLKLFVVAPEGVEVARARNRQRGGPLDEAFECGLAGASRRGLAEIFQGGLELAKLHRFLLP